MNRLALVLILTCVLSVSALAGDIPTAGVASTPPPPPKTQEHKQQHCHNDPSDRSQFDALGNTVAE